VSTPLTWVPTGFTGGRATLGAGPITGTLAAGYDTKEAAAEIGIGIVSAILGGGAAGQPTPRYTLRVEGADVDAVPVSDGERCR
jgi:hypothetical protein